MPSLRDSVSPDTTTDCVRHGPTQTTTRTITERAHPLLTLITTSLTALTSHFNLLILLTFLLQTLNPTVAVKHGSTGPLTPSQEAHIDAFLRALLRCRNMPGLAVTAVTADRVLLARGYGVSDLATRRPVTPHTLFPIASNTKAFTATLLAILLQENNGTNWDTPVKHVLGSSFELYDDLLTEHTSLRDLLAHRTGVPDYFLPLMAVFPDDETREKMVWRLRYHKPVYPFRSKFRYNNYMYMLAGHVAEKLGKASWEDLVRTRLMEPLGMTSSTFIRHLENWADLATSYAELDNGQLHPVDKVLIKQVHAADPAGSIVSTARDVGRWLQLHLRGGRLPGGQVLVRHETLMETYREEMPSPQPMAHRDLLRPEYPVDDVHLAYDMGWMTNVYRGYKRVWHSGGLTTYKSQVWFYPDLGLGLAIVCSGPPKSSTSWALINALHYLTDVLTAQQPWLNASTACSFPQPWLKPAQPVPKEEEAVLADDVPPGNVADLVGVYHHPGFGDLTVTLEEEDSSSGGGGARSSEPENGISTGSDTGSRRGSGTTSGRLTGSAIRNSIRTGTETITEAGRRQRLRMRMGQFLEARLLYNGTEGAFYTNLTGLYWYSSLRIPLRFSASPSSQDDTMDTVHMPLNSPWAEVEPFAFVRGRARHTHVRTGVHRVMCTSSSPSPATAFGAVLIAITGFCLILLPMLLGQIQR